MNKDFIAAIKAAYALRKAGIIQRLNQEPKPYEQLAEGAPANSSAIRSAIRKAIQSGIVKEGEGRSAKGRAVPTYAGDVYFLTAANDLFEGVNFCPSLRQLQILELLNGNRDKSFTLREVAETIKAGTSIVQRDLNILKKHGLVSGGAISFSGVVFCDELRNLEVWL